MLDGLRRRRRKNSRGRRADFGKRGFDANRRSAHIERRLSRLGKAAAGRKCTCAARIAWASRRTPPVIAPSPRSRRPGRRIRAVFGSKRRDGRAAASGGCARAFARERRFQRMHQQRAHQPGIAKTHFGLGRMHIHVELAWIERDEQRHQRMTIARQIVGIGGAHSAEQKLVAHRAIVDEKILAKRIGARECRQRRKALHLHAFAFGRRPRLRWRGSRPRARRRAASGGRWRPAASPRMSPARAPRRRA